MIFLNFCDRLTYNLIVIEREGPLSACSESRRVTNRDKEGLVPNDTEQSAPQSRKAWHTLVMNTVPASEVEVLLNHSHST